MTEQALHLDQAADILREAVPDAKVVGVARMDGGRVSGAYEVLCEDPARNAVVKIYAADRGWVLSKEIRVYRILREHGITKIPQLLGGAGSDGLLGRPYLVMTKLPGTTVGSISATLSDSDLRSVYRQMGELVAQIHAIPQDAYGYLIADETLDPQPSSQAFVHSTLDRVSQTYVDVTGDRDLYSAAHAYVAARADLFALCEAPVLLHNDFHEGNVIVEQTPNGPVVTGVIDVENAIAGDPVMDLAKTHSYSIRSNTTKLEALFEGYGSTPTEWRRRFSLFQVMQLFELWDFFNGREADTPDLIAMDLRDLIAAG